MATKPIPFTASQATGDEELGGAAPRVVNLLLDGAGSLRTRPGIAPFDGFPPLAFVHSPVIGIATWRDHLVWVTEDRRIWAIPAGGGPFANALSSADPLTKLDGATRPVFALGKNSLYIIGGGFPQKWTGAGLSARLGGSPPPGSHIAATSQRLEINRNDLSGFVQFSEVGEALGYELWDTIDAGFREAAARPDRVVAIADNANELFVFGEATLEVFVPDEARTFATGRALNLGTKSPYSIVPADEAFCMLDVQRRFVVTNGRGYQEVSQGLFRTIRSFANVVDVHGFRMQRDQWDVIGWHFPTDARTFAWQKDKNRWSEWRAYAEDGYVPLEITAHCGWPERNVHLVGLSNGQIAQLQPDVGTDLGSPIKSEAVSGFVDHGSMSQKHCQAARFKFRRGQGGYGTHRPPTVLVSWRDDTGAFGNRHLLTLGNADQVNPVLEIRSAGVYRQRQWRLEFSDSFPLTFIGADEDVAVLEQ